MPPSLTAVKPDAPDAPAPEEFSGRRRRRGLKPGQKHAGSFQKGHDPRRHVDGPNPVKREFQEAIRDYTDAAIQVLANCMADGSAPWKERQAAAELVLAHGHGSPVNRVMHAQVGGSGQQASTLSLADLRSRASALLSAPEAETSYETTYEVVSDD